MLKTKLKPIFLMQDADSISKLAVAVFDEGTSNHQLILALKRATCFALTHELTARQQQCFTLRYQENLRLAEISARLGVSVSTVSRHIRGARWKIQAHARYCVFAYRSSLEGYAGGAKKPPYAL